jgi:AcrR family transcriptional regulator
MATRRQQQKEETARKIFESAVRLFREQGFERTTVEEITRDAGVAKGTFFAHFPNKEAVLDHIGSVQMQRVADAIGADPSFAARDTRAKLHLVVSTLTRGVASQQAEMRALTIEILARRSLLDLDRQNITALDALLEQIIGAGQRSGELRADTPAARLAMLVRGAYFLALFEWVGDASLDLVALAAGQLELVLDGIARRGA